MKERIRSCYRGHYGQWGPQVLAAWCLREKLGRYSASTIARVIADLRDPRDESPPVRRYEITGSNVMWSEDGTGFGRRRRKRELLVVQDEHARYKVGWRLVDGPAKEEDVVAYLEQAFREHGPPLVLKHDGASIFHGRRMRALLRNYQVLDLTGPAYWPRYNGTSERSMRDIKSMERAMRRHGVRGSLQERLRTVFADLNEERPRPVLAGYTAREVYDTDPGPHVDQDAFRKEVALEMRQLRGQARSRRERHAVRRHAIERVLLTHGLLTETTENVN